MDKELETWQNVSAGGALVWRRDGRGDYKDALIAGGHKLTISRDDRKWNMEAAASSDLDIFSNGVLSPVRLIEGTEDAAEFASNPNLISDSEMKTLFKSHWKTFETKISQISNEGTLHRILAVAESDTVDATVRQLTAIKNRLDEMNPMKPVEVTSTPLGSKTPGGFSDAPSSRGGTTPR